MTKEDFSAEVLSRQSQMYRIARSYLRGEQDCLDAISEAILRAWQKKGALRDPQYFGTWLCRILIHVCINMTHKQKRMLPMENLPVSGGEEMGNVELRQVLDTLPQKLRIVTVLRYMEDYSVEDIAQILRIPEGTVSSRLHHARKQLRVSLKEEWV